MAIFSNGSRHTLLNFYLGTKPPLNTSHISLELPPPLDNGNMRALYLLKNSPIFEHPVSEENRFCDSLCYISFSMTHIQIFAWGQYLAPHEVDGIYCNFYICVEHIKILISMFGEQFLFCIISHTQCLYL